MDLKKKSFLTLQECVCSPVVCMYVNVHTLCPELKEKLDHKAGKKVVLA